MPTNPLVSGNAFVNVPLSNLSVGYALDQTRFIADRVFPRVPVALQGGQFYVWDNEDMLRDNFKLRADGTESQGVDVKFEMDTYYTSVRALHRQIGDQLRANAPSIFSLDSEAVRFLMTQGLINKEVNFFSKYFRTGVWSTEFTGTASSPTGSQFLQWNNDASNPIVDVEKAKTAILLKTGYMPNKLIVPLAVHQALKEHPEIIERVKYGGNNGSPAMVNEQALAALFGVDEYLVSTGILNAAPDGITENRQFFASNDVLLAYAPANAGVLTASAGYTFVWTGYIGNADGGARIKKIRLETHASDRIEAEMAYDQKVVAPALGAYFSNAIA